MPQGSDRATRRGYSSPMWDRRAVEQCYWVHRTRVKTNQCCVPGIPIDSSAATGMSQEDT